MLIKRTLWAVAFFSYCVLGCAQMNSTGIARRGAALTGVVTDAEGSPVPNASVTLFGKRGARTATADGQGEYKLPGLPAGDYKLQASAPGYQRFETAVYLGTGIRLEIDAPLQKLAANPIPPAPQSQGHSEEHDRVGAASSAQDTLVEPTAQQAITSPAHALASQDRGPPSVTGTVTDKTGAVISGVSVTISSARGAKQTVVTNDQGLYNIGSLAPGSYDLTFTLQGFKDLSMLGVIVGAQQTLTLDVTLEPAGAVTEVEVHDQKGGEVETETSQITGTITQKELTDLGLNGRNFTQLVALAPGVSNQTGQDEAKVGVTGSVKYSVNGGRVEYNSFDADGADLLNTGINGSNSTLIVYPSLDAIQEVQVLTSNYGAMYGRSASGTVLVTTKSGGEKWHGGAYEFLRNEFFNARNYFDQTPGAPLYRRNDFGFTLGGPVRKGKTFFFWSEEFRYEKSPNDLFPDFNQAVPSVAERPHLVGGQIVGDFSDVCPLAAAGSSVSFSRALFPDCPTEGPDASKIGNYLTWQGNLVPADPNAVAILSTGVIPLPNSTTGCNSTIGSCYDAVVSPPTYWREELFRLDHNLTTNTHATFRYIHDSWDTTVPVPQWAYITNSFPTIENRFVGPGSSLVARFTSTISPSWLNELVFSYANSHITLTDTDGPGGSWQRPSGLTMGYLFNNGFGGKVPGVVIGGTNGAYGGNGFGADPGYMPWDHTDPTYSLSEGMSKVFGKHDLQFGIQVTVYQRNQNNNAIGAASGGLQGLLMFSNQNSLYTTGNAFADFVKGDIQGYQQDSAQLRYYQRYNIEEPYVQDDWKITPRLTANLGLRLSLFGPWYENNNNAYNWEANAFQNSLAQKITVDPASGVLLNNVKGPEYLQPIPLDVQNLDPRITNGLVHCGVAGVSASCMQGHLFNPAPRVGFAWDPRGDGKTSIRGGYGVFFEHGTGNEANTGSLEGNSPLVLTMAQNFPFGYGCIGGVTPGCSGAGAYPLNVTSIPTKTIWPYVQQWSLSVQRQLPKDTIVSFAYVGSKGTHLTAALQINQLAPPPIGPDNGIFLNGNPFGPHEPLLPTVGLNAGDCAQFNGSFFTLLNGIIVTRDEPAFANLEAACVGTSSLFPDPNILRTFAPGLGKIISLQNIADSQYHAFQTTLRRITGPLTLTVSYSYSHSLDDSSDRSDGDAINAYDIRSSWASSDFDERHLLNFAYVYRLPNLSQPFRRFLNWADSGPNDTSEGEPAPPPPDLLRNHTKLLQQILDEWEVSGITTFQSGTPYSVINSGGSTSVSSIDNAGVLNGAGIESYPDVVASPRSAPPPGVSNPLSFAPVFGNPAAFVAPQGLTFGDAGRNLMNNPHVLNFNVSFLKHFRLTESSQLEFHGDIFNIFNHTQFRVFDSNLGNRANNTVSCYGPGPYTLSGGAAEPPLIASGPNLSFPNFSAAGGTNLVTAKENVQTENGPVTEYLTNPVAVNCLTGSAFLHAVSAHRPRTMQMGLKWNF
jgi:hypothetical protein